MSFNIDRGLFKFDFTDHHAVLGIPVNADVKEVRKRYLKIARNLHPDSRKSESEAEKKQANQLLSKLVNPAYEELSQNNRDYLVNLNHMGRRLAVEGGKVPLASETAKQLAKSGPNLDNLYRSSVNNLAAHQYESLDKVVDRIAEISELNLVYLMLKAGSLKQENVSPPGVGAGIRPPEPGVGSGVRPPGVPVGGMPGGSGSPLPDSGVS